MCVVLALLCINPSNYSQNKNTIKIAFKSPVKTADTIAKAGNFTPPECPPSRYNGECHVNFIRKMQASFSWDWGLAAPSMGIWLVYLLSTYDIRICI